MKKKEVKEEDGAPMYMAQFTALMTILLAFFICLLTMGQEKASNYKKTGSGYVKGIREAFGLKGGLGLLPYWRAIRDKFPSVEAVEEKEKDDDVYLLGYEKGVFAAQQLDSEEIFDTTLKDWGYSIKIKTAITFSDGEVVLTRKSRQALDQLGGVFYNLSGYAITVCCYESSADNSRGNQVLAARRAAAIDFYLEERFNVPEGRVSPVGYGYDRYLKGTDDTLAKQEVIFFVRKNDSA